MRPRALIELLQFCRSHAVNLRHSTVLAEYIESGEELYSSQLVTNIGLEIREVLTAAADVLYELIEAPSRLPYTAAKDLLKGMSPEDEERVFSLLLWYGVLGLERLPEEHLYIYDVNYDLKRIQALINRRGASDAVFCINPAFWRGLEVRCVA